MNRGKRQIADDLKPGRRHPHRLDDESYRRTNLPMMVTCVAKRRWPVLIGETAETVTVTLREYARRREARLYGYCVLPDHLHFTIDLAADDIPPGFLRYFKGECSRRINVLWGTPGAFRWQRSYWDTFSDSREALAEQMSYMLANPVRRGLCERPADWPHSADLRFSGSRLEERP